MKKYLIVTILVIFSFVCQAQVDVLQMPSEQEKANLKGMVDTYFTFVNKMTGMQVSNPEVRKNEMIKFMKDILAKGTVQTINDIGGTVKDTLGFIAYLNRLKLADSSLTHTLDSSGIVYTNFKYDPWRRLYFTELKLNKIISWKLIKEESSDTSLITDIIPLSFFIRFEKDQNTFKNFKLFCITLQGGEPNLPPLEPLQLWWKNLDAEWKIFLSKQRTIDTYPKQSDLEKLTYVSELNMDNSTFKSYEPLSVFTNLKKLTFIGSSISSLETLEKLQSLTYLDITKSQVRGLSGVDRLFRLEEFYCKNNQLTSILPVARLINLVKFDCSENDLEDIGAVAQLTNLKELNISLNIKVKNIDAVKDLVNMEKISFRKIEIKDLTPLSNMKYLVYLDCYNTGITSLEPIRNLQKIFHLDLSNNKVTSLEPIKGYNFIVNLYLNSSSVSDLSVVSSFTLLRELEIAACPQIASLGGIHKLEYIKVLKCHYTKISKEEIQRFKKNHPNCAITYY